MRRRRVRRRRRRTRLGMSRRSLMRMRKVRSRRRRIPMRMKLGMGRRRGILLSLMRISERLWESHNRRYLERIRKGRRSLRRRRRKVHYN